MASLRWIGSRAADLGRDLVGSLFRDNKLLPPILALLTLFVFAWVLAGVFVGGTDGQKPVSHRSEFAQSDAAAAGSDPAAPEVNNPNVDSYAAYRSKDPFRRVILFASKTTPEGTAPAEKTTTGGGERTGGRPAGGGGRAVDTDRDGLPDRKEAAVGTDPNNPDTDGDGTPDGLDDANGDGVADGVKAGGRNGPGGRGGRPGQRGDLLDSGGTLAPPK